MQLQTIQQLNQLNQQFYQTVASSFSQTRQSPWAGWLKLMPWLQKLVDSNMSPKVLDLGCGNGRFGQFLADNFPAALWQYLGVDQSPELLKFAPQIIAEWQEYDLVADYLNQAKEWLSQANPPWHQKYNLIAVFGVMHHIPSQNLRLICLKKLCQHLEPNGLLIVSDWQFMNDEKRFQTKQISPENIDIPSSDLETNDYLLNWQNHPSAVRYCHLTDLAEINQQNSNLIELFPDIRLKNTFFEDGKTHQLNHYRVWQKTGL